MKKLFLSILIILCYNAVYSQTVENIRVEPEGDKINIHYRIGGSVEGHIYNVGIECSLDGGPRFVPKAVMGDVGKNIRGGKSVYTIIWDVFDDVDEVGNAEFFITVDLVGGTTPQYEQPGPFSTQPETYPSQQGRQRSSNVNADYNRVFLAYELTYINPVGIRIGTLGNWGIQGSFRIGYDSFWESYTGSVTLGPTKRIVNLPRYRLHGYVGAGIGDYFDIFQVEFGVSNVIVNRLVLDFGFEYSWYIATVIGIGIAF